jgi:predicted site-specific integrase-resolvase
MHQHYPKQLDSQQPLLDRKSLASRWGVSIETIKRREADGSINPVYLPGGRLVRYRLAEIIAIENNG